MASDSFTSCESGLGAMIKSERFPVFVKDTAKVLGICDNIRTSVATHPNIDMDMVSSGCRCRLAPATIADLDSPLRML